MAKETKVQTDYVVTVEEVYGRTIENIQVPMPEVYELSGEFRPPKDEAYIDRNGWRTQGTLDKPRLILRQRRFRPRRIVFEATGEYRAPRKGEWYRDCLGIIQLACSDYEFKSDIYTRWVEGFSGDIRENK